MTFRLSKFPSLPLGHVLKYKSSRALLSLEGERKQEVGVAAQAASGTFPQRVQSGFREVSCRLGSTEQGT
jgi:hypothetical protein